MFGSNFGAVHTAGAADSVLASSARTIVADRALFRVRIAVGFATARAGACVTDVANILTRRGTECAFARARVRRRAVVDRARYARCTIRFRISIAHGYTPLGVRHDTRIRVHI